MVYVKACVQRVVQKPVTLAAWSFLANTVDSFVTINMHLSGGIAQWFVITTSR